MSEVEEFDRLFMVLMRTEKERDRYKEALERAIHAIRFPDYTKPGLADELEAMLQNKGT